MNKYFAKFMQFMQGRYGIDSLYKFLLILYCASLFIFSLIGFFFKSVMIRKLIVLIPSAIVVYAFWRVFSKNIPARQEENRKYLVSKYKFTTFFNLQKNRWKFRKTDVFKKCPKCKAVLKLKKISGKHTVRCPSCGCEFKVNNK